MMMEADVTGHTNSSPSFISELLTLSRESSIRELCLPRTLDEETLTRIAYWSNRDIALRRGETLFRQGNGLHALYVVAQGSLKTVLVDSSVDDQILGFHFRREVVGLDALHRRRHACSALALESCRVHVLPVHRLEQLMGHTPAVLDAVHGLVSKALVEHEQLLAVVNQRSALERVAVFFFSLSCRLGCGGVAAEELTLPVSRAEIANYLGLATETVSRSVGRLHDDGILQGHGKHMRITDLPRLYECAVSGGSGFA